MDEYPRGTCVPQLFLTLGVDQESLLRRWALGLQKSTGSSIKSCKFSTERCNMTVVQKPTEIEFCKLLLSECVPESSESSGLADLEDIS